MPVNPSLLGGLRVLASGRKKQQQNKYHREQGQSQKKSKAIEPHTSMPGRQNPFSLNNQFSEPGNKTKTGIGMHELTLHWDCEIYPPL